MGHGDSSKLYVTVLESVYTIYLSINIITLSSSTRQNVKYRGVLLLFAVKGNVPPIGNFIKITKKVYLYTDISQTRFKLPK